MNTSLQKNDIDLFKDLTDSEFIELKSMLHYEKFKKGDFIIKGNNTVEYVFFIYSGLVKLSFFDDDNKESILSFAFENWWETDFSAFYNQVKSTLTLQCLENTETFGLSFDDYITILNKYNLSNYFLGKSIKGHIASQKSKSFLINLNYIDSFDNHNIYIDDSEIPLEEVFRSAFFTAYYGDSLNLDV